jgi:hypothetical protein
MNARPVGSRAISPLFRVDTREAAGLLFGLQIANERAIGRVRARLQVGDARPTLPILEGILRGTVRYRRSDPREHWQTWRELNQQLQARGVAFGDCEDLASAVAAELQIAGEPARTYVYQSGPKLYHVVVATKRWGLLDPSRAAGMEGNG